MIDQSTILILASLALCPTFLVIGMAVGAMLVYTFSEKRKRRWHTTIISAIRGRDIENVVRGYIEDGWDIAAVIPNEVMTSAVDVHLKKFM